MRELLNQKKQENKAKKENSLFKSIGMEVGLRKQ